MMMAVAVVAAAACGAGEDRGSGSGSGSPSAAATGGAGGTTSTGGAAVTIGSGGSGGNFNPVGTGGGENCLEGTAEATISPLDIVVVLDRSFSMAGTIWNGSVNALTQFFQNPGGTDISAGITYMPPPNNQPECQPSSYNPPDVPIVSLATSSMALVNDMQSQTPTGNTTPLWAALYGTYQYANDVQDQNTDHVVIVVLASDGDPTSCNSNVNDIADLAAQALAYNGVRTFTIAILGGAIANLDQIAAAGGTMSAYDVTNDITQFKQKMDEIRKEVLACEYVIPDSGMEFDPTKVNVNYYPGGNPPPQSLPQAASLADCGNDPGWYYDNPAAPTKILLCPASCNVIQLDDTAKVEFVFGCPTIVN
jgi:hypothetical protein